LHGYAFTFSTKSLFDLIVNIYVADTVRENDCGKQSIYVANAITNTLIF